MSKPVIGLEIHIQLITKTKMFCSCSSNFGDLPNTNICPICLGYPGTLPVLNQSVVEMGIKLGLALDCKINTISDFSRKNYFYPDLPKGYQITQYNVPLAEQGFIKTNNKKIRISRIHLEEDSAKMFHGEGLSETGIDFNRAGTPLLEVVTEPDIEDEKEAGEFLNKLQSIIEYLSISTGKMEEGALRCDVNISMTKPDGNLGTRVEIKNLNSFRSVTKSIQFEVKRQTDTLLLQKEIEKETRSFDEKNDCTVSMRKKSSNNDYRYFSDPDLGTLKIDPETIEAIKKNMPELPEAALERLTTKQDLMIEDARIIVSSKELLLFFDSCYILYANSKTISNWITSTILKYGNQYGVTIEEMSLNPTFFVEILNLLDKNIISVKIGKLIVEEMIRSGKSPNQILNEEGLSQLSNEEYLLVLIRKLFETYPKEVLQYKAGKTNLIDMFIGEIMVVTNGKANPGLLKDLLLKNL